MRLHPHRSVRFNFFLLLQEKVTKRIANLRQVDRLCKPWRMARKPGETPHPISKSVAPFTRFFGSRAAMPASCSAQGALTELLFPPIHNPFPRSLAYALKPSTFTNPKKLTRREPFPSILWKKSAYPHRMGKVSP